MSIKDLFKNKTKNQVTNESTLASASVDVESYELVKAKTYKKDEFVPPIDYATASNFAKYGSAELYYEYAFKRVYEEYPYDGTLAEKIEFENSSSYLDKYILEEIYPRTNGYVTLGYQGFDGSKDASGFNDATTKEYIKFFGGPHTASGGMLGKTFDSTFGDSTLYDVASGRESNLQIDFAKGATIEFWLKKDGWDNTKADKEVVFDVWNQADTVVNGVVAGYYPVPGVEGCTINGAGDNDFLQFRMQTVNAWQDNTPISYKYTIKASVAGSNTTGGGASANAQIWSLLGADDEETAINMCLAINGEGDASTVKYPSNMDAGFSDRLLYVTASHLGSGKILIQSTHPKYAAANVYNTLRIRGSTGPGHTRVWAQGSTYQKMTGGVDPSEYAADHSRASIFLSASADGADPIWITYSSGSAISEAISVAPASFTTSSLADGKWHHYAISLKKENSQMVAKLYVDGEWKKTTTNSNAIDSIAGASKGLVASVGSMIGPAGYTEFAHTLGEGDGKLSASMDEFRFWKTERDAKQIGYNWFTQVGGGTDDYTYNTDLGVYYKFNEGITTTAATDATVLDYSGRLSNGQWTGYTSGARSTDSAIVLAGAAEKEFKDPIIYSSHPTVTAKEAEYKLSGSEIDYNNPSLFHHLLPSWLIEDDQENGQNIRYLTQIMASYFDTLHSQLEYVNKIKDENYSGALLVTGTVSPNSVLHLSGGTKPLPFARNLLRGRGFVVPNLFVEANIIEEFLDQDNNEVYEKDIAEVKNKIYQNIYNNLLYIYKSKGTEKSFRNLFRAFGVDSSLIKLNMYADGATYTIKDNYEFRSVPTRMANFNHPSNFEALIYASSGSLSDETQEVIPTTADAQYSAFTTECEVLFPKKLERGETGYFGTAFLTSSIFGFYMVDSDNHTFHSDDKTIQVYIVRDEVESPNAYFLVTGSNSIQLTSSRFTNLYDNNKWNLALRYKHSKYPQSTHITGGTDSNYELEFYAVNSNATTILNQFELTTSVTSADPEKLLTQNKKLYVGANRTNFTGSVIQRSDVKVSHLRYWQSYLSNEVIKQHSYDVENYGPDSPYDSDAPLIISNTHVPKFETLALNWDFAVATGSDASGQFYVPDASSGSSESRYGWMSTIVEKKHPGLGFGFAASSTKAIDKEYVFSAQSKDPHNTFSSDMITIKGASADEVFFEDDSVADNFYSLEKSMQSVITDEMVKMFGSIIDFNNVVGDPVNQYRPEYKELNHLRRLFFERVENDPDQEKFFEFYKWIDTSISYAVKQLFPASTRFSDGVANVIESHVLEKNKYQHKFPLVAQETSTEGSVRGRAEASYNWELGHAPMPASAGQPPVENKNLLWQTTRREHSSLPGSDSDVLAATEVLRSIANRKSAAQVKHVKVLKSTTSGTYLSTYPIESSVYQTSWKLKRTIHGGINYPQNKNRDYVYDTTRPGGPVDGSSLPINYLSIGLGVGTGIVPAVTNNDEEHPLYKKRINIVSFAHPYYDQPGTYEQKLKGHYSVPFNAYTSSLAPNSGYLKQVHDNWSTQIIIANLHSDTTDLTNEIPMQGPFAETHVGGHQSRHVPLNKYDTKLNSFGDARTNNIDDFASRPETWQIAMGSSPWSDPDGVFAFIGADYGSPYPQPNYQLATRYRNVKTKRPVNLQNIQHNTGSGRMGNYNRNYEVLSGFGRAPFARAARRNSTAVMSKPPFLTTAAYYTNPVSLIAAKASISGNTLSAHEQSNRFHSEAVTLPASSGNTTKSIIGSVFSAPGGPEVQTDIFLDKTSKQYSVHNALPFRNLGVRSSGSGEADSMWAVQSHASRREGFQTHLRRHSGKFGIDSVHGAVTSQNYSSEPNFQKQHRNTSYNMTQPAGNVTTVVQAEVAGRAASGSFWVSGAIFDGTFTTGAFEMTGRHIAGFGSKAKFDVAAISAGTYASGSFRVSGSTVNTTSTGSFDVTGAFGPGVFSSGSFTVTGAHVQAASASASFTMQSIADPGERLYSIFDVSANVYDRDYIELEGKTFEVETGNPYGDGEEAEVGNTFALERLNWQSALLITSASLTSSEFTSPIFTNLTNDHGRDYWFSTWIMCTSSAIVTDPPSRKDLVKFYFTGSTSIGSTYDHGNQPVLEIYFSSSDGSVASGSTLYVDRYWFDRTATAYETRSYYFTNVGGLLESTASNADHWKSLQIYDFAGEVHLAIGSGSVTSINAIEEHSDIAAISKVEVSNPPIDYGTGDFWMPINKVEQFNDPDLNCYIDETALWNGSISGSSTATAHRQQIANKIFNTGKGTMPASASWTGNSADAAWNLSASALEIYWRFGDHSGDNVTNKSSPLLVQDALGDSTRNIGLASWGAAYDASYLRPKKSRFYQTKSVQQWFDHVKTTINTNLTQHQVDYRHTSLVSYADFTGPWYVTGGLSDPATIHSGDTIYLGRFVLTRSSIAADTVSINVQNGLSGSPAQTSSFLIVESGNGTAGSDLASVISHSDDFAFSTYYEGYINHLNSPHSDVTYSPITTYNNTASALHWGPTTAHPTAIQNNAYSSALWGGEIDSFSVSFWLNPMDTAVSGGILHFIDSTEDILFILREDTDLIFRIHEYPAGGSNHSQDWYATNILTSSTWQHVAFSFTGGLGSPAAAPTSTNRLWINGQLSNKLSVRVDSGFSGSPTFLGWTPTDIGVGDSLDNTNNYELQGALQDLCFWTGSLSDSDAAELYNYGRTKNVLSHQNVYNLMHWWKLGSDGIPPNYASGDQLTASFGYVDYGFISNIPKSAMGSTQATTLTTNHHQANFITGGIPTDSKTDSVFWSDFVSSFNTNVTNNFTASNSTNTITLNTTTMGTSLNGIGLTENGGTFTLNNAQTTGGVDPEGATFGHSIEIGTKKFELTQSGGSLLDGTATGVLAGPTSAGISNVDFWNSLKSHIESQGEFTVNTSSAGANLMKFSLTASATGSAANGTITNASGSFTPVSVTQLAGGLPYSGSYQGNSITIGGVEFKLFTGSANPYTSPIIGVSNTGSNADFWAKLTQSIAANTNFDFFNTSVSGDGQTKTIQLTSSASSSVDNVAFTRGSMVGAYHDFNNLAGAVGGGIYVAGVQHSHSISFNSQKFIFYTGSSIPAGWPVTTAVQSTGSGGTRAGRDTDFWTRLSQSISGNTVFKNIPVTQHLSDNEATFHLTATTAGTAYNGQGTLEPGGNSSFQSVAQTNGGTSPTGLADGETFIIDGVTFEFDIAGDGVSGGNTHVTGTYSDTKDFWNHFESVIVANTTFDFVSWYTGSTPPSSASFQLSSSVTGANRANFGSPPSSITNIVQPYGATYMSGANNGDTITFAGKTFEMLTGSVPSDPSYIRINGIQTSNLALWQAMSRSIELNTDLSCSGITDFGGGKAHLHLIATVATTSLNGSGFTFSSGNKTFFNTPTASPLAGGQDPSGSTPGDYILIDGVRFQIVTGSEPVPVGAIRVKFSGSPSVYTDDYVWTKLEDQIEAHTTNYDASRISYVAHGNKALFSFTASSEIATGYGLSANPSSQTFWDLSFLDGTTHIPEITNTSYQEASYSVGYDNAYVNTPIPRSDFQYSWIRNAVGTGRESQSDYPQQVLHGYAPYDGIVSASSGLQEAIVFPAQTTDVECSDSFMPIYGNQHGLYTQTYECGVDDPINWAGLLTFTHPQGIDSGYPVHTIYDSGGSVITAPSGTGSFYVDYTASYGSGAGTIERRVTVIIQDTVPPVLTATDRPLYGDAVYTPQTTAPMNNASYWWPGASPAQPQSPFAFQLTANESCGTVTWTSGGFGAIPTTGSGYVPGTYAVSFTASDSNGLASSASVDLEIQISQLLQSHFLHPSTFPFPKPAPPPFVDYGPTWVTRKQTSPMVILNNNPETDQHGPDLSYSDLLDHVDVDADGHAWYPIPSASWWDPAAHADSSDAPASNKVIGNDEDHWTGASHQIGDIITLPAGWTPVGTWPMPARPGYILIGVRTTPAGLGSDMTRAVTRSGLLSVTWSKTIRGQIYSLTSSYKIVG